MIYNASIPAPAPEAGRRLLPLDGARGLSALMVAMFHFDRNAWPAHGYLAVDLFFLLSGYVIAGAYEKRLRRGEGLSAFFVIRMARLYPLYLFGTLIGLGGYLTAHPPAGVAQAFLKALIFLPGQIPGDSVAYPLNGVMWTLVAEVQVNLLYAWFGYRLSTRALAASVIAAGAVLAAVVIAHGGANLGCPARVLFAFPLGVVVWRLHSGGRLPKLAVSALIPLLAAIVVYAAPFLHAPRANGALDAVAILLALPLILVGLVLAKAPKAPLAWACGYTGALSYALYAIHLPVSDVLNRLPIADRPYGGARVLVLGLAIAIPIAMFGHHVVEPAGRRLILSRSRRRKATTAAVATAI